MVAQSRGLFAAQGLDVELVGTPNSVVQMKGLIDGSYDIAMTAMDNVIAYNEGQGESETKEAADLVAVLGADNGFLRLVGVSGVGSDERLKGRTLAVDALTTATPFATRDPGWPGLKEGVYELVRVGVVSTG